MYTFYVISYSVECFYFRQVPKSPTSILVPNAQYTTFASIYFKRRCLWPFHIYWSKTFDRNVNVWVFITNISFLFLSCFFLSRNFTFRLTKALRSHIERNGHLFEMSVVYYILKLPSWKHQPIHRKDGWTLTNKSSITWRPWHDVFRWRPSSPRHSSHNYKRKPCFHGMASWTRRTNAVGVDTESDTQVSNGH